MKTGRVSTAIETRPVFVAIARYCGRANQSRSIDALVPHPCFGIDWLAHSTEAWMWYQRIIGKDRCPIVDTWWQTEAGAIIITPLPGAAPTKPGSATNPFPGIEVDV